MCGQGQVQPVPEDGLELHPQQPSLGQHGPLLLHAVAEAGPEGGLNDHQRLPQKQAVLGAADGKGVAARAIVREVRPARVHGAAQPRAVAVQVQPQLVAAPAQGQQFRAGVDRAQLRGVGDVSQPGNHGMLVHRPRHGGAQEFRRQLPVRGGQAEDRVAVLLHGPGLVDADVSAVGGKDRLIGPQERGDGRLVYLGAAHKEVDSGVRYSTQVPNGLLRLPGILVRAVAGGQVHVGLAQGFQHRRMGPRAVVVSKVEHV